MVVWDDPDDEPAEPVEVKPELDELSLEPLSLELELLELPLSLELELPLEVDDPLVPLLVDVEVPSVVDVVVVLVVAAVAAWASPTTIAPVVMVAPASAAATAILARATADVFMPLLHCDGFSLVTEPMRWLCVSEGAARSDCGLAVTVCRGYRTPWLEAHCEDPAAKAGGLP